MKENKTERLHAYSEPVKVCEQACTLEVTTTRRDDGLVFKNLVLCVGGNRYRLGKPETIGQIITDILISALGVK